MKARTRVAFALLVLLWGSAYLCYKVGLRELKPFTLVTYRLVFASLGMLAIVKYKGTRMPRDRRTWFGLAVIGVVGLAVPFLLVALAEQSVDSAVAAAILATEPLFTVLISHMLLTHDRLTR